MRGEHRADERPATVARSENEHSKPPVTPAPDWSKLKAWTRRELALVASGASQEEREKLNP